MMGRARKKQELMKGEENSNEDCDGTGGEEQVQDGQEVEAGQVDAELGVKDHLSQRLQWASASQVSAKPSCSVKHNAIYIYIYIVSAARKKGSGVVQQSFL